LRGEDRLRCSQELELREEVLPEATA
jgi:hypothetical protein